MSKNDNEQNPPTLISGTRGKYERKVTGLRTYEEPGLVAVYDINHNFLRYEEPGLPPRTSFNGRG